MKNTIQFLREPLPGVLFIGFASSIVMYQVSLRIAITWFISFVIAGILSDSLAHPRPSAPPPAAVAVPSRLSETVNAYGRMVAAERGSLEAKRHRAILESNLHSADYAEQWIREFDRTVETAKGNIKAQ